MRPRQLQAEGRDFAERLSVLLNGTVCTGIRISAVEAATPTNVSVGFKVTRGHARPAEGIPLTLGRKPPSGYLGLGFQLSTDDEEAYLMVTSSFMGLFCDGRARWRGVRDSSA